MNDRLRALITLHEGRKPHVYNDSMGFATVGVGHLVDRRKGGKLPEHIIDALLDHDIETHTAALYKALPWIVGLDEVRRSVLIDMAFNLGVPELLTWKITLGSIRAGEYQKAADEMLRSQPWASQVKTRAVRLAEMMRLGTWPSEIVV